MLLYYAICMDIYAMHIARYLLKSVIFLYMYKFGDA